MAVNRDSVIGIDVGGTKTRIVVAPIADSGESIHDVTVPSALWRGPLGNPRADAAGLRGLLVERLGADALETPLAVGCHGLENTRQCQELEVALAAHFTGPVTAVNDSELIAPAMGLDSAVNLVVGTGSIATARSDDGELMTSGGWGWLLGDEGSAPALVREATRAVLASLDRGERLDALGVRLMAAFSARDAAELALAVTDAASATTWGTHAPEVFAAADDESAIADAVIRAAGEDLAELIFRLLERGVPATAVVAGGAVIERQRRLQESLGAALARGEPSLELRILAIPPVFGAVALAGRIASQTTTHQRRTESARP